MKRHRLLVAVFASMAFACWAGDTEIIVESFSDGLNPQAFSKEGKWTESTAKSTADGLQATKSVFNDANTDPGSARFAPEIPVAGKYEVFITYPTSGNATDIKYTIVSADGSKEVAVTQNGREAGHSPAANEWHSLGTFTFNEGNSGYVELADPLTGERPLPNEPNARIYADAIKFVPQGISLPADYVNKGKTGGATTVASAEPTPAPAAASTPAPMPGMPALPPAAPTSAAVPGLPSLPPAAPTASASAAIPGLPALPATPASDNGLPALPPSTANAAAALPGLPATPGAAAMPGLSDVTAAQPAAALPTLPAGTPQTAMPDLPSAPASTPAVTAQATPDLPSLAPVTPTPQRTLPSPADTPVAGVPAGLPGGRLASMTPALPTPMSPATNLPGAPALPGMPTPAVSATDNNPANLQWMYDFGAALNVARTQNKKVMVFFTANGNNAAQTYETQYFTHPAVRQALNNYILVKVDFTKNTRLGYSLGIFGAGIIVVTDSTGDVTARIEQLPPTPSDMIKLMAGTKPAAAAPGAPAVPGQPVPGVPAAPTPAAGSEIPATPAESGEMGDAPPAE